jgi:alpha-beta hydrolase superfamily lysophospholipase
MRNLDYFEEKIPSHDNQQITVHHWPVKKPKALIQLIHGMSEHGYRYNEFANWLNKKEIYAYSMDLRGHGKTAQSLQDIGVFSENDGWNKVVLDIKYLTEKIAKEFKQIPTIILGHSMGSFLARSLASNYPNIGDFYIFSATGAHPGLKGHIGGLIARLNSFLFGKSTPSKFLQFLVMGDFNKKIKKPRTKKDWLTRDEKAVDAYIKDSFCMQIFKNQFFVDLAYGAMRVNYKSEIRRADKNKAVLFFSGEMDPVGDYGKGVQKLFNTYKKNNFKKIEIKLFSNGRHEMLNELNKEEVYNYIYNWIEKTVFHGK